MSYYEGKIAIVTGAAGGIGGAVADALYAAGATVVVTDINLTAAEQRVQDFGERGVARHLDVCDPEAFAELADAIRAEFGHIDLLVNNAGVGLAGDVRDMALADWKRVIDVNLYGVIHGVHAVYADMTERGSGQIINIASGAGLCPRPGMVPYAASKAAVIGLSTSLRPEAAGLGVRVNVVCPGFIETDIQKNTTYKNLDTGKLLSEIPLKPMAASKCASIILRGAKRDRGIIPVSIATNLEWSMYRLSPSLLSGVAKFRARKFQDNRGQSDTSDE